MQPNATQLLAYACALCLIGIAWWADRWAARRGDEAQQIWYQLSGKGPLLWRLIAPFVGLLMFLGMLAGLVE
ncbi:MAG TPA: hypothetical protein VGE07_12625 [Herpetosiphonaceae bacterium]